MSVCQGEGFQGPPPLVTLGAWELGGVPWPSVEACMQDGKAGGIRANVVNSLHHRKKKSATKLDSVVD